MKPDLSVVIKLAAAGELDRVDMRIIDCLAQDIKAGSRRIAKAIGLPESTVRRRVLRMRALLRIA